MAKDILAEIAARKKQIAKGQTEVAKLEAHLLEEFEQEREEAQKLVAYLDAKIAAIRGKPIASRRRKKTSSKEMERKIFGALSANPKGLRLIELKEKAELPYGSVYLFIKNHPNEIKGEGKRKQKRYFLK